MSNIVFIVIAVANPHRNADDKYIIDGVYTSLRKAEKRANLLNSKGTEWLLDHYGCGCFEIEHCRIRTWDKTDL